MKLRAPRSGHPRYTPVSRSPIHWNEATGSSLRPRPVRPGPADPDTNEATRASLRPPTVCAGLAHPDTNEATGSSLRPPTVCAGLAQPDTNEATGSSLRPCQVRPGPADLGGMSSDMRNAAGAHLVSGQ